MQAGLFNEIKNCYLKLTNYCFQKYHQSLIYFFEKKLYVKIKIPSHIFLKVIHVFFLIKIIFITMYKRH